MATHSPLWRPRSGAMRAGSAWHAACSRSCRHDRPAAITRVRPGSTRRSRAGSFRWSGRCFCHPPRRVAAGATAHARQCRGHGSRQLRARCGGGSAEFCGMGIPFTHVDTSDSVEGWKARDIPSLGDIRSLGLITLGRFRSSTRGLAAKRRAVSISGGFAGRMALSAPTARPWASRGECRAACCAVEPAIGRYR